MRLHAAAVMASKTFLRYPSGMRDMVYFIPMHRGIDQNPLLILGKMPALFDILTQVTYPTYTRRVPKLVMSLPLGRK